MSLKGMPSWKGENFQIYKYFLFHFEIYAVCTYIQTNEPSIFYLFDRQTRIDTPMHHHPICTCNFFIVLTPNFGKNRADPTPPPQQQTLSNIIHHDEEEALIYTIVLLNMNLFILLKMSS